MATPTIPQNSLDVPRFVGVPTFMRLPVFASAQGLDVAIGGLPSDNGSPFRTGARFGPNAIRQMSVMLRPYSPYRGGIDVFRVLSCGDVGDAGVVPGYMPATLERLEAFVAGILEAGAIPLCLGGDHGCSIAELRAVAKRHGPVGLLHFDSHSDTWDAYFGGERHSAGTPFRRAVEEGLVDPAHSIQIGLRGSLFTPRDIEQSRDLGYDVVTADDWADMGAAALAARIAQRLGDRPIFVTYDIDVVDPAYAPGVQTPEAGGPTSAEALRLLRLLEPFRIVGADVVEVNPLYDGPGQITALLAATVASELLAIIAAWKLATAR
jgi:agmatinase